MWLNIIVDTLKLGGVDHVLSCLDLAIKANTASASKESDTETHKFLGTLHALNLDGRHFGFLNRDLDLVSQLVDGNYLILLSSAHEALSTSSDRPENIVSRG